MNLAFFIARRMARPTSENRPGVMERIAVGSVALGVAVMIVTLAVVIGFKREVARKMEGFAAHVSVTDIRGVDALDSQPVRRNARLEALIRSTDGFVAMAPYAVKGGIVRTEETVGEVILKGVEASYDWSLLGGGDKVEMLFVDGGERPRRDRFKVAGIYESGLEEMDRTMVLTDIRNVQRLSDWGPDEISGYEIRTRSLDEADAFARTLGRTLLYDEGDGTENLAVESVTERYANIFDWLKAHDVNAAVIIVIMLVVAFFNMTSALLILVLERTRTIGLLKTFGMRNAQIRAIFLWRAAFVTLRGLCWGNLVGVGLCIVQQTTHLVRLDPEGYLLSEVPVALEWGWWLALNAGFIVAIVALLMIPTAVISRIKPEETIRYE